MHKLAREPLAHFALLGTLLYAGYTYLAPPAEGTVVVPQAVGEALVAEYVARVGEPPSPRQRQTLLQQWVDDEVLMREARALGLDRSDPVIRRRLRQLGEMLIDGPLPEPTASDVDAWIAAQPQRYPAIARVSFEQRYFADGPNARATAVAAARQLKPGGEPFAHGNSFAALSTLRIDALFGAGFASQLEGLPAGMWAGPLRSRLGWHLVRIDARFTDAAGMRSKAATDWQLERRVDRRREALAMLRQRYDTRIEAARQ